MKQKGACSGAGMVSNHIMKEPEPVLRSMNGCPRPRLWFGQGPKSAFLLVISLCLTCSAGAQNIPVATNVYQSWPKGPPSDPNYFPIGVWLQNPSHAERYRAAGFNTYVGLWHGPTEEQLAALSRAGMRVICEQNSTALRHLNDPTIVGWMHEDEPDNAQELPDHRGYGPPVLPSLIVESLHRLKAADPSRPVLLNLGQGVAWDQWHGRGSRSNHPEDYPKYIDGCDIVSFDIYPVVHDDPQVAGHLNYVAKGVDRLIHWTEGKPKIVWNAIECTHISNPDRKPSPDQVRAEAWMSLIHGSRGLIYFVHEFKPRFSEAALLSDKEMRGAVTRLNQEIGFLAPVLNEAAMDSPVVVRLQNGAAGVDALTKRHGDTTYVFAVETEGKPASAEFNLGTAKPGSSVEVIGEERSLTVGKEKFTDSFRPWEVHLYRLQDHPSDKGR